MIHKYISKAGFAEVHNFIAGNNRLFPAYFLTVIGGALFGIMAGVDYSGLTLMLLTWAALFCLADAVRGVTIASIPASFALTAWSGVLLAPAMETHGGWFVSSSIITIGTVFALLSACIGLSCLYEPQDR